MSPEVKVDAKEETVSQICEMSDQKPLQFKQSLYLELHLNKDGFKFIKSYMSVKSESKGTLRGAKSPTKKEPSVWEQ